MSITLTRFEIQNFLEETGNDINFIQVYFSTPLLGETKMPYVLPYDNLRSFLAKTDVKTHDYLLKIRRSVGGYGSKHSKVFKIMTDEGFNLQPYIQKYLEELDDLKIAQHYEWCKTMLSSKNQEAIQKTQSKLNDFITPSFIQNNINSNLYKEEIDEALHLITLKYYATITDKDNDFFKKYKSILVNTTLSFTEQIDKLTTNG